MPKHLIGAVRNADWLTPDRARAWCRVLAVFSAVAVAGWVGLSSDVLGWLDVRTAGDFHSFWSASYLALHGQTAAPYDEKAHAAVQQLMLHAKEDEYYAFYYPPVFLLLCLPLALLPYLASLAVWLSAGLAALFLCLRKLLPYRWATLPMLAFPGTMQNIFFGQNGFISASCFGGGMILLQRQPFLAGLCLGGLAFKPHFALLVPVALAAARRWRAFAGAACSALALAVSSWLVLGQEAWRGFLNVVPVAQATFEQGLVGYDKMQSVFAAVRLLHGSVSLAYAAQTLAALGAAAVLALVALRRPGGQAEGAVLVVSALICAPQLLAYDTACLALPMAWVMAEAQRTGWLPWEKSVLLVAYVMPLLARPLATAGVPVAPAVLVCLLLVVARRALPQVARPERAQAIGTKLAAKPQFIDLN